MSQCKNRHRKGDMTIDFYNFSESLHVYMHAYMYICGEREREREREREERERERAGGQRRGEVKSKQLSRRKD